MQLVGPMEITIFESGVEVPLDLGGKLFDATNFFFDSRNTGYSGSVAYALNAVMLSFKDMAPERILEDQFSVEINPGEGLRNHYAEIRQEHSLVNLTYSLGVFKNGPCLIGQGRYFAPIPLGKTRFDIVYSDENSLVERAVFSAFLESSFQPVTRSEIAAPMRTSTPGSRMSDEQIYEQLNGWIEQHKDKSNSPWMIDCGVSGYSDYTFVFLEDGSRLPWNL